MPYSGMAGWQNRAAMMEERPDRLGDALWAARLVRGKTYRDCEEATGVPSWRIRSLELGTGKTRPDEFARLWAYLRTGEPLAR